MSMQHPTDNGPKRGPMTGLELRARLAIGDLGERDLDELIGTTAKAVAAWRAPGISGAEHRVLVRKMWPELGHVLDALSKGPAR